jgi:hypothetical protein
MPPHVGIDWLHVRKYTAPGSSIPSEYSLSHRPDSFSLSHSSHFLAVPPNSQYYRPRVSTEAQTDVGDPGSKLLRAVSSGQKLCHALKLGVIRGERGTGWTLTSKERDKTRSYLWGQCANYRNRFRQRYSPPRFCATGGPHLHSRPPVLRVLILIPP